MKRCRRCKETKVSSEFYANRRAPDGLQTYCKPCQVLIARHHRALNPEIYRERDRRSRASNLERTHATYRKWDLKTAYGITPAEYDRMLEDQGGVCAICGTTPLSERAAGRRLAVDHNHESGAIRRLLCSTCNRVLGLMSDNSEWLRRGADYLEEARNAVYDTV